jgi:hypothetical protein
LPEGAPACRHLPVDELDDDAVGVSYLKGAFPPLLDRQRHGDGDALGLQPGQLALEVVNNEREDQPGGRRVALVLGQRLQASPQEDDVDPGVVAGQGCEAVGRHLLMEPQVGGQERAGRGDVVDVERHG